MSVAARHPRIIVFDLDATLWYPEMYHLWGEGGAPFRALPNKPGAVADRTGTEVSLIGSLQLLSAIADDPATWGDVLFAVASTTDETQWAVECLQKIRVGTRQPKTLAELIPIKEIYKASSKQTHFKRILQKARALPSHSDVDYSSMIFFDDLKGNVRDVADLGVFAVHCPDGLTDKVWNDALNAWSKRQSAL